MADITTCSVSCNFLSFCEDHDELICENCNKFGHRLCKHVVDIDTASKGVKQLLEFKTIEKSWLNLKDDLKKLKKAREDDKTRIGEEKQTIKQTMQTTIQNMKATLETLERSCNTTVDRKATEFESSISADIAVLEKTLKDVDCTIQKLHGDEQPAFVAMKRNRQVMYNAKTTAVKVHQHVRNETISLDLNPAIAAVLNQKTFGDLVYSNPNLPPKPKLFHEECKYTSRIQGDYIVNTEEDKACHILDSCVMPDGSMVLTEILNSKLIHIDKGFNVQCSFEIPGKPWGICTMGHTNLAVTLIGKNAVQIVSLKKNIFMLEHTFQVDIPCRGICFTNGKLYVCCGGGSEHWKSLFEGPGVVKVFTVEGICLNTYEMDNNKRQIFGRPRDILYDTEDSLFYITDEVKGVITLDKAGKLVTNFKNENLIKARGIAFDSRGQIFVGCMKSKEVLLFRKDGTLINIPVPRHLNIHSVRSLCFLADGDRLLITSESNRVGVFNLTREIKT